MNWQLLLFFFHHLLLILMLVFWRHFQKCSICYESCLFHSSLLKKKYFPLSGCYFIVPWVECSPSIFSVCFIAGWHTWAVIFEWMLADSPWLWCVRGVYLKFRYRKHHKNTFYIWFTSLLIWLRFKKSIFFNDKEK